MGTTDTCNQRNIYKIEEKKRKKSDRREIVEYGRKSMKKRESKSERQRREVYLDVYGLG